jgi:hypothetical protein
MVAAFIGGLIGALIGVIMTTGLVGSVKQSGGSEDIRSHIVIILGINLITFGASIGAVVASNVF